MSQNQMESAAHQFAVASNVERIEDSVWAANIAPDWDILGSTNGGYLLATIARAMSGATERPNPLTITGHYLAPVTAQPIQITTNVLKSGKNIATATGTMFGDGRPLVTALGALSHANRSHETSLTDGSPPDLPSPEDSVRLRLPDGDNSQRVNGMPPPFADKVDLRLHPQDIGFAIGKPSGIPRMRAWFQLPNGEPLDVFALILAADSLPPTVFNSGLPIAWTPTVELTVHVRAMPEPGWLRLDYQTRFISNGLLEVDGLIWDSTDRLVAQSRQLALVPEMP